MKRIRKVYIPAVTISFTMVMVLASVVKFLQHDDIDGFAVFAIELFGYLIVTEVVDWLLCRIDFKSYFSHFLVESIALYPIMMVFAFRGRWFGFRPSNIIMATCIFLLVIAYIHYHFYQLDKADSERINTLLRDRDEKRI